MSSTADEHILALVGADLVQHGGWPAPAARAGTPRGRPWTPPVPESSGGAGRGSGGVATGGNADGYREILGVAVSTAESGAGWNTFFKDLVAPGLNGVALVSSDAHTGLVDAIGAKLPGATWQRRRTHYTANLMTVCPKSAWGGVKALLHSVFDQIDTDAVQHQYDSLLAQV